MILDTKPTEEEFDPESPRLSSCTFSDLQRAKAIHKIAINYACVPWIHKGAEMEAKLLAFSTMALAAWAPAGEAAQHDSDGVLHTALADILSVFRCLLAVSDSQGPGHLHEVDVIMGEDSKDNPVLNLSRASRRTRIGTEGRGSIAGTMPMRVHWVQRASHIEKVSERADTVNVVKATTLRVVAGSFA